jgi:hypothetical protein
MYEEGGFCIRADVLVIDGPEAVEAEGFLVAIFVNMAVWLYG